MYEGYMQGMKQQSILLGLRACDYVMGMHTHTHTHTDHLGDVFMESDRDHTRNRHWAQQTFILSRRNLNSLIHLHPKCSFCRWGTRITDLS